MTRRSTSYARATALGPARVRAGRGTACARATTRLAVHVTAVAAVCIAAAATPVTAQDSPRAATRTADAGPPLQQATLTEHLGRRLPLELRFVDTRGDTLKLAEALAADKPTILVLAYFTCRTLCDLVLDGTARALADIDLEIGRDYRVVTVSIDPRDDPAAARMKRTYVLDVLGAARRDASDPSRIDRPVRDSAWSFLVGSERNIHTLADAIGFHYAYDRASDQYAHPAAIFVLSPDATISAYIYGVEYEPGDIRAALERAKGGGITATVQRVLLRCFHFIPALTRHRRLITGLLRGGGILSLLAVVGLIVHSARRMRDGDAAAVKRSVGEAEEAAGVRPDRARERGAGARP